METSVCRFFDNLTLYRIFRYEQSSVRNLYITTCTILCFDNEIKIIGGTRLKYVGRFKTRNGYYFILQLILVSIQACILYIIQIKFILKRFQSVRFWLKGHEQHSFFHFYDYFLHYLFLICFLLYKYLVQNHLYFEFCCTHEQKKIIQKGEISYLFPSWSPRNTFLIS